MKNNFGKYFMKLDLEDQLYLMNHNEGNKCWQTDYRLLREKSQLEVLNNSLDEIAIFENMAKHNYKQVDLFPNIEFTEFSDAKEEEIDRCPNCKYLFEYRGECEWIMCPCKTSRADITESYIRILF